MLLNYILVGCPWNICLHLRDRDMSFFFSFKGHFVYSLRIQPFWILLLWGHNFLLLFFVALIFQPVGHSVADQSRLARGGGGLKISSDGDNRMRAKMKAPPKIPRASSISQNKSLEKILIPKNPMPNFWTGPKTNLAGFIRRTTQSEYAGTNVQTV